MAMIVLSFPGEALQVAHLLAVRFLLPSLLGRLIITQVRFLYLFGWLRAVFWGTVEVWGSGSHLLLQKTFARCHRSFLVSGFAHKKFVYHIMSVTNYILHFSICLHICCSYNPVVLYKPQCLGLLKHEAYAKSCHALVCRKALGVQISFHTTQNYRAIPQPSQAFVWQIIACLSSAGSAGPALNPPAWAVGFTAELPGD